MGELEIKDRDYLFDNLKGILIFLVVFAHIVGKMYSVDTLSNFIFTSVYVFHMPMFIFISGYFSKKFKLHKIIDLFIVYSLWQLIIYPVCIAILTNQPIDFTTKLHYPHYTYWYILSLITWKCIVAIIPKSKILLALFTVISYIPCFIDNFNFTPFSIGRTITFFPFFYAGYVLTKDDFAKLYEGKSKKVALFGLVAVFAIVYIVFIKLGVKTDFLYFRSSSYEFVPKVKDIIILRSLVLILSSLCIIYITTLTSTNKTILSDWGQSSFIIYLTHSFIVKSFKFGVGKMNSIPFVILSFIFSYGFCIFISNETVKKYIGTLTNFSIKKINLKKRDSKKLNIL